MPSLCWYRKYVYRCKTLRVATTPILFAVSHDCRRYLSSRVCRVSYWALLLDQLYIRWIPDLPILLEMRRILAYRAPCDVHGARADSCLCPNKSFQAVQGTRNICKLRQATCVVVQGCTWKASVCKTRHAAPSKVLPGVHFVRLMMVAVSARCKGGNDRTLCRTPHSMLSRQVGTFPNALVTRSIYPQPAVLFLNTARL